MASFHLSIWTAFFMSVVLNISLKRFADEWHFLDLPDTRKLHEGAVPLCGGIAIFAAFVIANIWLENTMQLSWPVVSGLCLILVFGALDDRFGLPALPRLLVQTLAAYMIIGISDAANFNLSVIVSPELADQLSPIIVPMAIIFIVGIINAVNMTDGVDGLAGGSAAASLFWLALLALHAGHAPVMMQSLILLAAVVGFLGFNLRHRWRMKASVFLGDAGSTLLGAAIGCFIVALSVGKSGLPFPVLLWLIVIPIVDTLSLIVRRIAAGRNPLSADRWHLHHLLLEAGLSPARTTVVLVALSALCGAIAYFSIILGIPEELLIAGLLVPAVLHTIFVLRMTGQSRAAHHMPRPASPQTTIPGATP
ncbi:undecaprenyl/decaprenyl-phosphate alpha-N-acetylglucosaminyl 1-phosphate transferase [Phyllobacterium salinisoli]|uniref:Undecaprenyl/decaprenyl-phosphate alpha-N-acetylglucosaminyl 1-phosphate transferase n=2 Tax=Phyllobacterium salinisoli TaxID=1899321 RepID=A0A368K3T1_9HYPH|nr:undecaprenyl/decaprenyl-phosphate alpha-N-acetylglucosaminyl 1-phosphate transferase [Phyllobacterium salinisoli]